MPILSNAKHEAFAQALVKGQSADEAYISAGYKPNRGNASRLKTNEHVLKRAAELAERSAERAEIDIARTLKELVRLGTSDLRRLFDGNQLKCPQDWPDDLAAAVSSIEVVTRPAGKDEVEYIHKIKLWDKNSALEKIAKHLNMFATPGDSPENPLHVADVSDAQRLAAVALMAARAVRKKDD